jgi:hypothetical protein
LRKEFAVSIDGDSGSTQSFMPLKGLPVALGGLGASMSAGFAELGADATAVGKSGAVASRFEPPQALSASEPSKQGPKK